MEKDRLILRNISKTSKIFHEYVRSECEKLGIPASFHGVIMNLARSNGQSQLELSNKLMLSKPTISLTLQKMEFLGYIERHQDAVDARITRVYLTELGYSLDNEVRNIFKRIEEKVSNVLSEEKQKQLFEMLNTINNELNNLKGEKNATY